MIARLIIATGIRILYILFEGWWSVDAETRMAADINRSGFKAQHKRREDNLCKSTFYFLSYCIPYLSLSHSFLWLYKQNQKTCFVSVYFVYLLEMCFPFNYYYFFLMQHKV